MPQGRALSRPLALGVGALLVVALAAFFGQRAVHDWQMLHQPPAAPVEESRPIRPWMTIRFIANSHGVPVPALAARLGASPGDNATLAELARAHGVSVPQEVAAAQQAVAELRAAGEPPGSGPRSIPRGGGP